jgi:hypothetical protein
MSLIRRLALCVGVALFLATFSLPVIAQQGTGNGLQITPTRTEIQINPGEVKTFSITVKNVTQADVLAQVSLNDFESDGLTGEPKIIVNAGERTTSSLDRFLKGLEDITLKAGESKVVNLTIDAPGDAPPGAYYGAIRFTAAPANTEEGVDDRQVTLTASVASLVLVEVSGDITEQIQLRSAKIERKVGDEFKAGSFFMSPPSHMAVEVKNNGNSFSKPFGRVTINKGGKEVYSYEINAKDPRGNILPRSVRTFRDEIQNVNKIGRYTADVSVSHGSGGEILTQQVAFWYMPAWIIIVLLLLLIGIGVGAYFLYKKKFARRRTRR